MSSRWNLPGSIPAARVPPALLCVTLVAPDAIADPARRQGVELAAQSSVLDGVVRGSSGAPQLWRGVVEAGFRGAPAWAVAGYGELAWAGDFPGAEREDLGWRAGARGRWYLLPDSPRAEPWVAASLGAFWLDREGPGSPVTRELATGLDAGFDIGVDFPLATWLRAGVVFGGFVPLVGALDDREPVLFAQGRVPLPMLRVVFSLWSVAVARCPGAC